MGRVDKKIGEVSKGARRRSGERYCLILGGGKEGEEGQ